jgi:hypothetical protein
MWGGTKSNITATGDMKDGEPVDGIHKSGVVIQGWEWRFEFFWSVCLVS